MRRTGWWLWAGLGLIAFGVALALAGTRFGRLYLTPLGWTGIILTVDGLLAGGTLGDERTDWTEE